MGKNPKPLRQIKRRIMRALQRQGPTPFSLPPEPENEADRERLKIEDEMLMRIVPPQQKRRHNHGGVGRGLTPAEDVGREILTGLAVDVQPKGTDENPPAAQEVPGTQAGAGVESP